MQFKFKEVQKTSTCGEVTWVYPLDVLINCYNPFTNKYLVKKWFYIIPVGGFHLFGIRCTWGKGNEIKSKRIVRNLGSS